jgi:hypothetical protein
LEKSDQFRTYRDFSRSFLDMGSNNVQGRTLPNNPPLQQGESTMIDKETADSLERQAARLMERAAEVRARYERFGVDDFEPGAVIVFNKRFNEYGGRSIPWSKPYFYAATKDPNGLWSTTGPRSPKGYTWDELIRWMGEGVTNISYVSELTEFVG